MSEWWGRIKAIVGVGSWVNAAINTILHWQTIVTVAATGVAAIWAWWTQRDWLDVFVYGAIIFAVFTIATNQISEWRERRRQASLKDSEVVTESKDVLGEGATTDNSGRYHHDRDIYINDFITDEQRVMDRTFERCTIFGPAVLWLFKCQISTVHTDASNEVYTFRLLGTPRQVEQSL